MPFTETQIMEAIPTTYKFIETLGRGSYGQVVACWKTDTEEIVALKFFECGSAAVELEVLETMKKAGMENANIVKFLEHIETPLGTTLVFEPLNKTMMMHMSDAESLPLCDIRSILHQIGTALSFMAACGYVHRNIKLNNIMVRESTHPLEVKLIDFGAAEKIKCLHPDRVMSLLKYSAPEIILHGPHNEGIDVWALGVSVISAMLESRLFPDGSDFQVLSTIVKLLGQPPNEVLDLCKDTSKHFNRRSCQWKLKKLSRPFHFTDEFPSLRALIKGMYKVNNKEREELECLIDLLERMMDVNSKTRITADQICTHPFITRNWEKTPVGKPKSQKEQKKQTLPLSTCDGEEFLNRVEALLPANYKAIRIMGYTNAGVITQCLDRDTRMSVSVLVLSAHNKREALTMNKMMKKHLHKQNIVEFFQIIDDGAAKVLVLENLEWSLIHYALLQSNNQLSFEEVREISAQVATGLVALQSMGLTHGDLTMYNIWFTDLYDLKIKLVDFTSTFRKVGNKARKTLKSATYRAPEVILGLPITSAVDVWSLACTMAHMLLGYDIFPEKNDFGMLKLVVKLFGQPSDELLDAGTEVKNFFKQTNGSWRLMTDKEYLMKHRLSLREFQIYKPPNIETFSHLLNIVKPSMYGNLKQDSCVDLLMKMFEVDAAKRITPAEILRHRFITNVMDEEEEEEEEEVKEEEEKERPHQSPICSKAQPVICHTMKPQKSKLREMAHELAPPESVEFFPEAFGYDLVPRQMTSCQLDIDSISISYSTDNQTCMQREDIKQKMKDDIGAGGFGVPTQRKKRVTKVIHGVWSWMKKHLSCWNKPAP